MILENFLNNTDIAYIRSWKLKKNPTNLSLSERQDISQSILRALVLQLSRPPPSDTMATYIPKGLEERMLMLIQRGGVLCLLSYSVIHSNKKNIQV